MIDDDHIIEDIDDARALLAADSGGGDGMPCSRYGRNLSDAYDVVYWAARILEAETEGGPLTWGTLDYVASLVVNDHPDPARMIVDYGAAFDNCPRSDLIDPDDFPELDES